MTSILKGARIFLAADEALTNLLGSSKDFDTWIFQYNPAIDIIGTQRAMIVLNLRGSWATSNTYNTALFPRLQIEIFADMDRDDARNPTYQTQYDKTKQIFDRVDALLHRPQGGVFDMGGIHVHASVRIEGYPDIGPYRPDAQTVDENVARGLITYAISTA